LEEGLTYTFLCSNNSTLRNRIDSEMHMHVLPKTYIDVSSKLLRLAPNWELPNCSMAKQINKCECIHTMEHHTKRGEFLNKGPASIFSLADHMVSTSAAQLSLKWKSSHWHRQIET
jgi:hypothetical protein